MLKETGILGITGSAGSRGATGATFVGEGHWQLFSHSQFQLAWTTPTHPAPKLEPENHTALCESIVKKKKTAAGGRKYNGRHEDV